MKHLIEAIEDDLRQIKIELDDLQAEEVHRQNRGNPEQRGNAQRGRQRGQQRGNAQRGNQRVPAPQIPQRRQQRAQSSSADNPIKDNKLIVFATK